MDPRVRQAIVRGDLKHALGYLGAAILFVGLFLPLFELPEVGRVNYFWTGGDGVALLLVVLGSVTALLAHQLWALWLGGLSALVLVGFTLLRATLQMGLTASQLQWGWPVLFIGGSLLVASAEVGRRDGVVMPRALWDVVVATTLVLAAIVIGPRVLSGTQRAINDFSATKKLEERVSWVPHESARIGMAKAIAHVRSEPEDDAGGQAELKRQAWIEASRRAAARRVAQIRLVSDIRRWYPSFADSLRPVLEARHSFLQAYDGGGLAGARPSCGGVKEAVLDARERLPGSPDPKLAGMTSGLLDLYQASAEACVADAEAPVALVDLERTEERIATKLGELSSALASYCLQIPAGDRRVPALPGSVLSCDPRDAPSSAPVGRSASVSVESRVAPASEQAAATAFR